MSFLRTITTRRLLALLAGGAAIVAVAGATIAIAAGGSGPKPPPSSLAAAVHRALAADPVAGVSARISFTNHLIDSSAIQGSDPILTGASGRVWWSPVGAGHLRLELQSDQGDAQILLDGRSFSVYDGTQKTVYRGALPAGHAHGAKATNERVPTVARIQREITQVMRHAALSGAIPGDVAGHAVYSVRVGPKHDGGLLGAAKLAWDAANGLPLRVAVYAQGNDSPVLELEATDVSYGSVPASTFAVAPPAGTKVVRVGGTSASAGAHKAGAAHRPAAHGDRKVSGVGAVTAALPFKLAAPAQLVGLPRQSVRLVDFDGHPGALVTYGRGLGGIAVIERGAEPAPASTSGGGPRRQGLDLPTVSIAGATGEELDTALGTLVRFTRAGISYTVLGSVPPAAAEAAARAL